MSEFFDLVARRRMTRSFDRRPIPPELLTTLVEAASRAPSAGKTQGWDLVVLEGTDTERFWDVTLPAERRRDFAWKGLLDAPVIALPFANPQAYVDRYSEDDKAATGLGAGVDAWPTPYWTVDTAMAMMTLLLAAEDVGLGALLFGVFRNEDRLREELGVPVDRQMLGAIALGYPSDTPTPPGRSAKRPRRPATEIIHRGGW